MKTDKLDDFLSLVQTRRSVRDFKPDPLPEGAIDKLLEAARWAPSGYNLQPVHYVVVTEADRKAALRKASMDQRQVSEAPAVVVFIGDRQVVRNHFEQVLKMDKDAGVVNETYEALMRKFVPLAFSTGPLGLGWLWKATLAPIARFMAPIPGLPAVYRGHWLGKQVCLSAMNFMLAAHSAGLATCPMEGFDSRRVGQVLGLPGGMEPMLIVPVGYADVSGLSKTRLPMSSLVHREVWGRRG